eukprot:CAMPEP_0177168438 /NCGR_PEP_ID=MMETSP0367-20130122/9064_1 /TAXON_ID=447022 ORGANISM="Scrippsiella hangoei-like, Strain SHHI-4" /NCGR_SAMPLE_ID=MMETSP0367 /ASSEMBLY_ACC=CAM_ASM_000362 /LENGTH=272 /DNA_ID=CAMNT_0018614567 /DNA_START=36 /DNA_END=856 /DNA_ORIENTATION=-
MAPFPLLALLERIGGVAVGVVVPGGGPSKEGEGDEHDAYHAAKHQAEHRLFEKAGFGLAEKAIERAGEGIGERLAERLAEHAGERLAERTGERVLEKVGERVTEGIGERLLERASERVVERTLERSGERALERGAERVGTRLVETTLRISEGTTLLQYIGRLVKVLHVLVPALGMLLVAHMVHQDFHRLRQDGHSIVLDAQQGSFSWACSAYAFDVCVHGVVVASMTLVHVDHHWLHWLEHYGLVAAGAGMASMVVGEGISAYNLKKSRRKE